MPENSRSQFEHSVLINSAKEKIWKILVDVERWKAWDNEVRSAQLDGDFAVGTKGKLVSIDNKSTVFFITNIKEPDYYSNYYRYPFFTKLHFTHKIEHFSDVCRVTFFANFSGPLGWYFLYKQKRAIRFIMKNAMANLIDICKE